MIATTLTAQLTDATHIWHLQSGPEVGQALAVSPSVGLSPDEVSSRAAVAGPNTLPEPDRRSRVMPLVDQVRNPLVLLLLGAAVIAGAVGDLKDAAVILAVVVINSVLGFFQQARAENSLESLRQLLAPTCVVVSVPLLAQQVFDTFSLTTALWLVAVATASVLLMVDELRKVVVRRRNAGPAHGRSAMAPGRHA